jgi:hypothetical protein
LTAKQLKRQQEYWNRVLLGHHLGMGRGTSSLVDYSGGFGDLDLKQSQKISKRIGRVKPKGNGPDK